MSRRKVADVEILSGWKEIANHMKKGVRTVQRYERTLRLPVHRPAGGLKGAVIATKAEIDAWLTVSPIREAVPLTHSQLDNASLIDKFHRHVEEMRRLREESRQLREEIGHSLEVLRASIQEVSLAHLQHYSPERRFLADVLRFDPNRKKVN